MSLAMWEGLGHALSELRDDPEVRVVILTGAGDKAFVSGADISQFEQERHNAQAEINRECVGLGSAPRVASRLGRRLEWLGMVIT